MLVANTIVVPIIIIPVLGRKYFDESDDSQNCDKEVIRDMLFDLCISFYRRFIALISQGYIGRLSGVYMFCVS